MVVFVENKVNKDFKDKNADKLSHEISDVNLEHYKQEFENYMVM